MKYIQALLFVFALLVTSSAYGQKFLTKDYKEWTQDEALKIITDSPWASEYQSEEALIAAQRTQQAREAGDNNRGTYQGNQGRLDIPIPVTMRLHSALQVRQAMTRLRQIQANYDKMSAGERETFDASTIKFLECAVCKGYYVVTLTKRKDSSATGISDGIFQTMKLEDLKGKVWLLNDRDEKLELAEFTPPKSGPDSAVFFFKRPAEKAFFTPTDKQIKFVFANELRGSGVNAYSGLIPKAFEFKVPKLVVDGEVQF